MLKWLRIYSLELNLAEMRYYFLRYGGREREGGIKNNLKFRR